jgi:hypothetical protein
LSQEVQLFQDLGLGKAQAVHLSAIWRRKDLLAHETPVH